jgi:amino acid transporter
VLYCYSAVYTTLLCNTIFEDKKPISCINTSWSQNLPSITTGIFTTYGSVLNSSGPLDIWTWPVVIIGQLFVSLVFAALASRIPLAGYSYQWVSCLANPKIGWLIGWISFVFLVVDVVAVEYAVAQTVLRRWHRVSWHPGTHLVVSDRRCHSWTSPRGSSL